MVGLLSFSFAGGTIEGESAVALDKTYVIAMYDATSDADLFSAEVYTVKDMTDTQPGTININTDSKSGTGLGMNLHGTVESVPDPTSGLLLLLGVAGLALKRRRV